MARWLWLLGPSGVGKSTVGWLIHLRLGGSFVDTDQLGLCYPAPARDQGNHRIKAANLAALRFPAGQVVVSGGMDDAVTLRSYLDLLPGPPPLLCRLRAGPGELRARVHGRGGPLAGFADAAVAQAAALDRAGLGELVLDTDGLNPAETAALVLARTGLDGG